MIKTIQYRLLFIALLTALRVDAQQDPQFSQYMFNSGFINPGAVGIDGMTSFSTFYRSQWTGINSSGTTLAAPVTQLLNFSTKIYQLNSGVGGNIMFDKITPLQTITGSLAYAYHLDLGGGKLGIGVRGSFFNQRIYTGDWVSNVSIDQDPTLNAARNAGTQTVITLQAGAWYQKEKYYVGISSTNLNSPTMIYSSASVLKPNIYVTGGYNFEVSDKIKLTPSILWQSTTVSTTGSSLNLNLLAKYNNDKFWGGVSYRQGDAIVMMVGVGLLSDNSLKIGFANDLTVLGTSVKNGTSQEIFLSYSIPVSLPKPSPIIRTPRFRF